MPKKFANYFLLFFRYLEPMFLLFYFGFFFWVVINNQDLCLNPQCDSKIISFLGYQNTIYGLTLGLIIPLFSIIGVVRILVNVAVNKTTQIRPVKLILGLILVIISHFIFAFFSKEFIYIYSTKNIVAESPIVTIQIFLILLGALFAFGNKTIWDQSSFFVKFRLVFYFLNLLVLLLNINYGILFFITFIPAMAITDIMRSPHSRI
jgi:hypothetical protein